MRVVPLARRVECKIGLGWHLPLELEKTGALPLTHTIATVKTVLPQRGKQAR